MAGKSDLEKIVVQLTFSWITWRTSAELCGDLVVASERARYSRLKYLKEIYFKFSKS